MITFKSEEEKQQWLINNAEKQVEWEKGLTWKNPKTGKDEPTMQALNHRTMEQALKIAKRALWLEQKPDNIVKAKWVKIRGRLSFHDNLNDDYLPILDVWNHGKEIFMCNCEVKEGDAVIGYTGKTADITNEIIDKYLCKYDTSENPSRPFRWYRMFEDETCVYTTTEEEIHKGRMEAFNSYLVELGEPEYITIFEI